MFVTHCQWEYVKILKVFGYSADPLQNSLIKVHNVFIKASSKAITQFLKSHKIN